MQHLSADRLSQLPDVPPTPEECAHLAACDACARERDAYGTLVGMARAEGQSMGLPLTRWDTIATELTGDAVVGPGSSRMRAIGAPAGAHRTGRWGMQVAAGMLLVAGGAMLGRVSASDSPFPERALASRTATAETPAALAGDSASFASVDEARAAQARSEQLYERAAAFLAQHEAAAATGSPVAYRSRLAALDQVISATREALHDAPHDPVINDYYLSTIGQREATLRQLNTALPASLRVNSF